MSEEYMDDYDDDSLDNQADWDNHANQCNPNNENYQGYDSHYGGDGTQDDLDNHANQMNPNNDAYYSSRGIDR
jgi:hypothetical protein